MLVNLPFLLLAIVLLWFPRQWMRLGLSFANRRRRQGEAIIRREKEPWKVSEPGDPAVKFGAEFAKLRNYVDVLRAASGSVALMGGFELTASLDVTGDAPPLVADQVLVLKIAILLVALLIQSVRYERHRLLFFAPIFFLGGLSLGMCGWQVAFFAFAMVWSVNAMMRNPQAFLTVYALLLGAFGMFFRGVTDKLTIVAVVLCLLPVVLSLLAQRPLVLFSRKGTRSAGEGA